jgi:spore photoproduct lyase
LRAFCESHGCITFAEIYNDIVSRNFEAGAPSFERRLAAAKRVQDSGYCVRVRLDPIVPFDGWKEGYAETIKRVFNTLSPETVTIGTLRFEEQFYKMRDTLLGSPELKSYLDEMEPMFEPRLFVGKKRPKSGKWSFSEERRIEIFAFAINEIRKYSNCPIALCKESSPVWNAVGIDLSRCYCACQLAPVDMTTKEA